MGESKTRTSGHTNTAEKVGLDRTHASEATNQHHTTGPDMEPAGEEEKRPALRQLEAKHRGRAETAGYQLERSSKSGPEPSALAGSH